MWVWELHCGQSHPPPIPDAIRVGEGVYHPIELCFFTPNYIFKLYL